MYQDQHNIQFQFSGCGGNLSAPVGLGVGPGYRDIEILMDDLRKQKFELPCFVPSKSKTSEVMTFDVDVRSSQDLA